MNGIIKKNLKKKLKEKFGIIRGRFADDRARRRRDSDCDSGSDSGSESLARQRLDLVTWSTVAPSSFNSVEVCGEMPDSDAASAATTARPGMLLC